MIRAIWNYFFPVSVDKIVAKLNKTVASLHDAAAVHYAHAKSKRSLAESLHIEADLHDVEQERAERVALKISELVS